MSPGETDQKRGRDSNPPWLQCTAASFWLGRLGVTCPGILMTVFSDAK